MVNINKVHPSQGVMHHVQQNNWMHNDVTKIDKNALTDLQTTSLNNEIEKEWKRVKNATNWIGTHIVNRLRVDANGNLVFGMREKGKLATPEMAAAKMLQAGEKFSADALVDKNASLEKKWFTLLEYYKLSETVTKQQRNASVIADMRAKIFAALSGITPPVILRLEAAKTHAELLDVVRDLRSDKEVDVSVLDTIYDLPHGKTKAEFLPAQVDYVKKAYIWHKSMEKALNQNARARFLVPHPELVFDEAEKFEYELASVRMAELKEHSKKNAKGKRGEKEEIERANGFKFPLNREQEAIIKWIRQSERSELDFVAKKLGLSQHVVDRMKGIEREYGVISHKRPVKKRETDVELRTALEQAYLGKIQNEAEVSTVRKSISSTRSSISKSSDTESALSSTRSRKNSDESLDGSEQEYSTNEKEKEASAGQPDIDIAALEKALWASRPNLPLLKIEISPPEYPSIKSPTSEILQAIAPHPFSATGLLAPQQEQKLKSEYDDSSIDDSTDNSEDSMVKPNYDQNSSDDEFEEQELSKNSSAKETPPLSPYIAPVSIQSSFSVTKEEDTKVIAAVTAVARKSALKQEGKKKKALYQHFTDTTKDTDHNYGQTESKIKTEYPWKSYNSKETTFYKNYTQYRETDYRIEKDSNNKNVKPREIMKKCSEIFQNNPKLRPVSFVPSQDEVSAFAENLAISIVKHDAKTGAIAELTANLLISFFEKFQTTPAFNKVLSSLLNQIEEGTLKEKDFYAEFKKGIRKEIIEKFEEQEEIGYQLQESEERLQKLEDMRLTPKKPEVQKELLQKIADEVKLQQQLKEISEADQLWEIAHEQILIENKPRDQFASETAKIKDKIDMLNLMKEPEYKFKEELEATINLIFDDSSFKLRCKQLSLRTAFYAAFNEVADGEESFDEALCAIENGIHKHKIKHPFNELQKLLVSDEDRGHVKFLTNAKFVAAAEEYFNYLLKVQKEFHG